VLKIAAGVFLGICAAFLCYVVINTMEIRARTKQLAAESASEAKATAEAYQARISDATNRINSLTADELIEVCGQPLPRYSFSAGLVGRVMVYAGTDGYKVGFNFLCINGKDCVNVGVGMRRTPDDEDLNHPGKYETYSTTNHQQHLPDPPASQIVELPCLIRLAELPRRGTGK